MLFIMTDLMHLLCVEKLKNAHIGSLVSCEATIHQVCNIVFICIHYIYVTEKVVNESCHYIFFQSEIHGDVDTLL